MNKKISSASHSITNEVIYSIITKNISDESIVLDFGAGQGFMSQKVGGYFQSLGQDQNTHLKSRFSFLLSGYAEMYGPLSIEDKNAGILCH